MFFFNKFVFYLLCILQFFTIRCYCGSLFFYDDEHYPVYSQEILNIIPDIHELVYRSYKSTQKDKNGDYMYANMLQNNQILEVTQNGHTWFCLKNFSGQKGHFYAQTSVQKCVKSVLTLMSVVSGNICSNFLSKVGSVIFNYNPAISDRPGFVAYLIPDSDSEVIWVAIVFRGTQSEKTSLLQSILMDDDWRTNLSTASIDVNEKIFGFTGQIHSGYVLKVLSCIDSIKASLDEALIKIGKSNWKRVKFVVCGHSQGGALAQVYFPILINTIAKELYGPNFDNIEDQHCLCYSLSTPPILTNYETLRNYSTSVGSELVISHFVVNDIVTTATTGICISPGIKVLDMPYDIFIRAGLSELETFLGISFIKQLQDKFDQDLFLIYPDKWVLKNDESFKIYWNNITEYVMSKSILSYLISSPIETVCSLINRANEDREDLTVELNEVDLRHFLKERMLSFDPVPDVISIFYNSQDLQNTLFSLSCAIIDNYRDNAADSYGTSRTIKTASNVSILTNSTKDSIKSFIDSISSKYNCDFDDWLWGNQGSMVGYLHFGARRYDMESNDMEFKYTIPSHNLNKGIQNYINIEESINSY